MPKVVYLRNSLLYLLQENGQSQEIQSTFASEAEQRASRKRAIDGWKENASAWNNSWMTPGWEQFAQGGTPRRSISVSNIARGPGNTIAYSLDLGGAGGLFRYDLEKKTERRLMHRNGFAPQGLSARSSDGMLAFSVQGEDGSTNIAVGERDGVHHRQITAGDTYDAAPSWWCEGERWWIYFHSAGICRTADGRGVGLGPASICRVPLDGGEIETVLESTQEDFIQPRVAPDGTLYCIRRPHDAPGIKRVEFSTVVKDVLLFPYRLARAAFYFANFISMMFAGRPLTSEVLDPRDPQTFTRLQIWGKAVDTQKLIDQKGSQKRLRLVPDGWQLIRKSETGEIQTLARHVVCFDIGPEGNVVYSDGSGIYEIAQGTEKRLSDATHVMQLSVL